MAKKYGSSYSDSSTSDSTGKVSSLPSYDTEKERVTFVAEFEDIRPDEAFSTLDYDGGVQRQSHYNYGPMVAFIKKFTINVKDDIESVGGNPRLVQFKINDVELSSEQYTISKSEDGTTYTIVHERPPLRSQLDVSNKTAWKDYIDPTDTNPTKFKYFLFDPVEITIRAKYSKDFLDSLSEDGKNQLRQRIPNIEKEYDIDNFGWEEITPIRLYDYWLTERVEYLLRYNSSDRIDCGTDNPYFFPSPFWLYQNHLPDESFVFPPGRSVTMVGLVASIMLQHMRFASYYSQHRTSKADGNISTADMERMFGRGWDLGGGNLDLISWDGVALEPIFDSNGRPAGFKQPKGKYIKLGSSGDLAPICYGCNRHPNWLVPMEDGKVLDCVDTKFCKDLRQPFQAISTPGPMDIEDIPRESPEIKEEETGYMTGIGKKPDFPTIIKREHFDRFFLLFSNVNNSPDLSPYMYLHLKGSVRVVPERSDMSKVLGSNDLAGHVEICPRRAVGGKKSSTNDIDGTKLSKLEFGVTDETNDSGDIKIISDDKYPYRFRSVKNYRDQFRTVLIDNFWDKLNIVKIYTVPSFPVRIQTKRAYKSLDYIRAASLYVIAEHFSGSPGIYSRNVTSAGIPGKRSRKCCYFVLPMPELECRCEGHTVTYSYTGGTSYSRYHFFGVFSNYAIPDWMIEQYPVQFGIYKNWSMFVRPEDLPRGAKVVVPMVRTAEWVRKRVAGESPCAPGWIGPDVGGIHLGKKTLDVPLIDMDPDEAQDLFDSLTENAKDHPCFSRPTLNGSNSIIVGYATRTFSTGGGSGSGRYQYLGPIQYIPGVWCQHDLTPGYTIGAVQGHVTDWIPGRLPFEDDSNFIHVNAGGDWLNTLVSNRVLGGWIFDYTYWCDHTFNFRDGEFQNCRCHGPDGERIF